MRYTTVTKSFACLLLLMSLTVASRAERYVPDAQTLHLWHFNSANTISDGTNTTVTDAVIGGYNLGLENGATLRPSRAGFAECLNTSFSTPSCRANAGRVPLNSFWNMTTTTLGGVEVAQGACTYEAIVYLGVDPFAVYPSALAAQHQIVSLEQGGATSRPLQFRLYFKTNATTPAHTVSALEFCDTRRNMSVSGELPASGPHAAAAGKWYHVMATYNGRENTPNNVKLYWTALDSGRTTPKELPATGFFTGDLLYETGTPFLMVGSQGRSANCPSFKGYIDQVRISSIARDPSEVLVPVKMSQFGLE